ncbi:glycosyltransferase family 2 protein [Micromonospora sp. NPDC050187]|uniref:glycosyltransferase family 2 protein n=1 Tax=Micromonospora sp. NPDC050187 TaxID=3364277 RepID=UPI0037B7CD3E
MSRPPACFVVPYHPDGPHSPGYLREAVGSVLAQTDRDWLLAIVHDPRPGTSDQRSWLAELVAPVADRSTVIHLPENQGPGGARNAGVDWALGQGADLVVFLDADDVCEPHRLAALRTALTDRPRAGMAFSAFTVIDEASRPRHPDELPEAVAEILDTQADEDRILERPWREMTCVHGYMSLTSTVAVRAAVAERCRFPRTMVSEDAHAFLRMFALCPEVVYLADPLTRYRVPRVPRGTASRQREGGAFYWTKALVDADSCFRVLMQEVASGACTPEEALDVLDAFWRRTGATLRRAGAAPVAAVVGELAYGAGGRMSPDGR